MAAPGRSPSGGGGAGVLAGGVGRDLSHKAAVRVDPVRSTVGSMAIDSRNLVRPGRVRAAPPAVPDRCGL